MIDNNVMRDEARALIIQGCEQWINQWNEGAIVTGWIAIIEYAHPNGHSTVSWATGDGMPTTDDGGWIAEHRFRGMIDQVRSELDAREVARQIKDTE